MVEQITVNPEEVRGYGNICEEHSLEDFIVSSSGLAKEKEDVHGALTSVYKLVYSLYGLMFDFDRGNKQLYLQMGEADILSFGFDESSKQLYLLDMAGTGLSLGFDEDTNELYITDDAPPIVHNYSLAFSAASYVATGGSATLECTLLDNNVPVEGATISVSGSDSSLYTGITDNSGVATVTVSVSAETTFTASYQGASATCTVTVQSYLFYDDCTSDRSSEYSRITQSGWRTPSITYNSDGYYTVKTATSNSGNNGFYIGDISGLQDCKISMKLNRITTSGNRQIGVALWNTSNNYHIIGRFESSNNSMNSYAQTNTVTGFINVSQTLLNNTWYALEFIKQGNDYTLNCYDDSGTLLKTGSGTNTTFNNVSTLKPFIFLAWDSSKEFRVKDIKVEAL